MLWSSIQIRRAGDEVEAQPGFFEGDTVAHCGPTLKGEFARTLNLTDVHTGWVFTASARNNAHVRILEGLKTGVEQVPFAVTGLDFERAVLNRLWALVNDRFNYLTPTKKPIGYGTDRNGRRTRLYDAPATPLQRLLAAKVLNPAQEAELVAYRDRLNPAAIGRQIADLQGVLLN